MKRASIAVGSARRLLASWSCPAGAASALQVRRGATRRMRDCCRARSSTRTSTLGDAITECPQAGLSGENPKPLDRAPTTRSEKKSNEGTTSARTRTTPACRRTRPRSTSTRREAEHRRRGERLPPRLGRRRASTPRPTTATTGTTGSRRSRRCRAATTSTAAAIRRSSYDRGGRRLLRADQLQPHRRHERRLGEPLDERRLHVVAALRRDPDAAPPSEQAAAVAPAIRASLVTARSTSSRTTTPRSTAACRPTTRSGSPRGRGPDGVSAAVLHAVRARADRLQRRQVGSDRLYVTYSLFSANGSAQIYLSYSDDRAHSWSAPKVINGSALRSARPAVGRATAVTTTRAPSRR